jgi:hypothetical protein
LLVLSSYLHRTKGAEFVRTVVPVVVVACGDDVVNSGDNVVDVDIGEDFGMADGGVAEPE